MVPSVSILTGFDSLLVLVNDLVGGCSPGPLPVGQVSLKIYCPARKSTWQTFFKPWFWFKTFEL